MMRILLLLVPALILSAQTAPVHKAAATTKAPAPSTDYKVSGSPNAPIEIDAYTDYECPHCALFFKQFMPQFTADYIATGKVKFVHRDFPIVQIHPHAMLAARYANAAGELGFYDVVVNQIFKTQDIWSLYGKNTGDIDGVVAQVIPPGAMQKVRELVKSDPRIDESHEEGYGYGDALGQCEFHADYRGCLQRQTRSHRDHHADALQHFQTVPRPEARR